MACLQRYELPLPPSSHMLGSPMTRQLSGSHDEEAAALLLCMSLGMSLEQVRQNVQAPPKLPVMQPLPQHSQPILPVSFPIPLSLPILSNPQPNLVQNQNQGFRTPQPHQDIPVTFHNITLPSHRAKVPMKTQQCANCGTTETPVWRNGETLPDGTKKHLCNACGLRWKRCQAF